jgi:hypothetical protein
LTRLRWERPNRKSRAPALINIRREKLIAEINQATGYPELLRPLSPLEVEDENQD